MNSGGLHAKVYWGPCGTPRWLHEVTSFGVQNSMVSSLVDLSALVELLLNLKIDPRYLALLIVLKCSDDMYLGNVAFVSILQ